MYPSPCCARWGRVWPFPGVKLFRVPDQLHACMLPVTQAMLRCNSAGLMCVTAAAHPGLYLNAS